jgi:Sulfatase-modifying factor enzyme 1
VYNSHILWQICDILALNILKKLIRFAKNYLMFIPQTHYVVDSQGQKFHVLVGIEDWEQFTQSLQQVQNQLLTQRKQLEDTKIANAHLQQAHKEDILHFINKLSRETGKIYRLPTEAEWEFAARGGNQSKGFKYSGSDHLDDVAWYDSNSNSKTHPVGEKAANELGIHDMSGNVWEWCVGSKVRGGSWFHVERFCRTSFQSRSGTLVPFNGLGLRLVRISNQSASSSDSMLIKTPSLSYLTTPKDLSLGRAAEKELKRKNSTNFKPCSSDGLKWFTWLPKHGSHANHSHPLLCYN